MGRCKGYVDKLLNGENHRFVSEDGVPNDGLTQGIVRNEVTKHADITLQHKPLSTTEGSRVALMNLGSFTEKSGAIRPILDTDIARKAEAIDVNGGLPRRQNCPCDLMMGCASETFRKPRGPP